MRLDNARHELFARHIANGKFASEAYRLAGFTARGNAAETGASRLLRNAQVAARIAELRQEAADKVDVTLPKVIHQLALRGFANILDYVKIDSEGNPVPDLASLSKDQAAALQELRIERYVEGRGAQAKPVRRVTFKLHNQVQALDRLAKILKGLPPPKEIELEPKPTLKLIDFQKMKEELLEEETDL